MKLRPPQYNTQLRLDQETFECFERVRALYPALSINSVFKQLILDADPAKKGKKK